MGNAKMQDILAAMARESNISMNVCVGVISNISTDYSKTNTYEQNALKTFKNFLEA